MQLIFVFVLFVFYKLITEFKALNKLQKLVVIFNKNVTFTLEVLFICTKY